VKPWRLTSAHTAGMALALYSHHTLRKYPRSVAGAVSTGSNLAPNGLENHMENFSQFLEQIKAETNMTELNTGDKIILMLRITEVIENIKDPDTIEGLKTVFKLLVNDLTTGKVQRTH
jgi:hypothetical protein